MKKSRRIIIPPLGPSKGSEQKRDANTVFQGSARLFELDAEKRGAASMRGVLRPGEDEKSVIWERRFLAELRDKDKLSSPPASPDP
jgi:hypothetical protein